MSATETAASLRRMNNQYDNTVDEIDDCAERQARGEVIDKSEFLNLLKKRQVVQDTLEAVVKFEIKTTKAVLAEAK